MQRISHILFCLALALSLAHSGPGVAGPMKGAMLVELCADGSAQQIWLDADGNPVQPGENHVKCIYCIMFSAPLPEAITITLAFGSFRVAEGPVLPGAPETAPVAHLRPTPRAPPAMVSQLWRRGDQRPLIWFLHLKAPASLDFRQSARPPLTDLRAIF